MESDLIAKQANKLIESVYRMEVEEQKVILLATKKVNDLELRGLPFTPETEIVITADDFGNAYGVTKQRAFEALVSAKNTIYDRSFEMDYMDANGEIKPISSRWIHAKGEVKHKSAISMFFTPAVIPYIYMVVKEEFTLIDLKEVGRLKSKYAVRLYQLLMKWRNANYQPIFTIETLRQKLGLDETEYLQFGDFNKRVINVAVDQINKGTGFTELKAIPKKEGRKVVSFRFEYKEYDNRTINVTPLAKVSKKEAQPEAFEVYYMTDKQILMYARKIKDLIMEKDSKFAYLGNMMDEGKGTADLLDKIENDFIVGNFEPYYEALQHLEFKPTKQNRTKQIHHKKPDPAPKEKPPVDNPPEKPAPEEKLETFPEDLYALYKQKNGKFSRDEIIEGAMKANMDISQYIGKLLVKTKPKKEPA